MSSFNIPFNINMIFKYAFLAIIIITLIYRFYSMSYQFILKKASMYWFLMLIPGINVIYFGMSKFKLAYGNYGFFIIYLLITTAISLITIPLKSSIIQLLDYLVQFIILIIPQIFLWKQDLFRINTVIILKIKELSVIDSSFIIIIQL